MSKNLGRFLCSLAFIGVLLENSVSALADRGDVDQLLRQSAQTDQSIRGQAYRLSASQIGEISRRLTQINDILNGQQPQPPHNSRLTCVSRDNDGFEPYQIAVAVTPVEFARIAGAVLNKADCQKVIADARVLSRMSFAACTSRDRDGMQPFTLLIIDGIARSSTVLKTAFSYSSLDTCIAELRQARESRWPDGLTLCGTRDGDGMAPYVKVFIDATGKISKSSEEYSGLDACKATLDR